MPLHGRHARQLAHLRVPLLECTHWLLRLSECNELDAGCADAFFHVGHVDEHHAMAALLQRHTETQHGVDVTGAGVGKEADGAGRDG